MKRIKKILVHCIIIDLILLSFNMNFANAVEIDAQNKIFSDTENGILHCRIYNNGIYIYKYFGQDKDLEIPNKVKELNVLVIEKESFYSQEKLTSVIIPNSVNEIGKYAFAYCDNLTKVDVSNSNSELNWIKDGAFLKCTKLTDINIPNSVTCIGNSAFEGCLNLEKIIIPKSVNEIGEEAFYNCYKLTIYGYKGSYAEKYAKENQIPFKDVYGNLKIGILIITSIIIFILFIVLSKKKSKKRLE